MATELLGRHIYVKRGTCPARNVIFVIMDTVQNMMQLTFRYFYVLYRVRVVGWHGGDNCCPLLLLLKGCFPVGKKKKNIRKDTNV